MHDLPLILLLPLSLLKLGISQPRLLLRLPTHPAFKYLSSRTVIANDFLHVSILIPKLIDPRHVVNSSFPNIFSMIDKLMSHFHFRILQPQPNVLKINLQRSFENRPRSSKLGKPLFPSCVSYPNSY